MRSAVYADGAKFSEVEFAGEPEFEDTVEQNSKLLFGDKALYLNLKSKITSQILGAAVPDGLMIDFSDREDIKFYLVENELARHDWDSHIFPQITKFFTLFQSIESRSRLVGEIFNFLKTSPQSEEEFRRLSGSKETYKALRDIVENSQNILVIIDGEKPEIGKVSEIYTEWRKMVRVEVLRQYRSGDRTILVLTPDFEQLELPEELKDEEQKETYTESYHLDGVEEGIVSVYNKIKDEMLRIDPQIRVNPQKYYISLRRNKNFAFLQIRRKKIRIVVMLPFETSPTMIKLHKVTQLSEVVQKFYNGPCFQVLLENESDLDEIIQVLKQAYAAQVR